MSDIRGLNIALTGKMRSGKDQVGKYLVETYGFKRFAFGDGIVSTTKELFPKFYDSGEKPRKLLQDFGQYCVGIDKDVWVDYLFREMLKQDIDPVVDNVVITDLRQPHEYEKLLESGFRIVRVNSLPHLRMKRMEDAGERITTEQFYHSTEQHIDDFEVDYVVNNSGSLEELYNRIDIILSDMTGGML